MTQVYHAMVKHLDDDVGKVVDLLHDKGMYNNTLFVMSSDNGTCALSFALQKYRLASVVLFAAESTSSGRNDVHGRTLLRWSVALRCYESGNYESRNNCTSLVCKASLVSAASSC